MAEDIRRALGDLIGWCSEAKALWLAGLVAQNACRDILEIGVFGGRSLVPMALAARQLGGARVVGVEPWSNAVATAAPTDPANDAWWQAADMATAKTSCLAALVLHDLVGTVTILELTGAEAAATLAARPDTGFDLIHIDGSHAAGQALDDMTRCWTLLRPGGIMVLDDIGWPGVAPARDALRARAAPIAEVEEAPGIAYGAYRRPQSAAA